MYPSAGCTSEMLQSAGKARHSQTVSRAWEIHATCASSAIQIRFDSSSKRFIIRRHLRKVFEGSRCVNGIFCLDHARSGQYAETVLISLMVSGHGGAAGHEEKPFLKEITQGSEGCPSIARSRPRENCRSQ